MLPTLMCGDGFTRIDKTKLSAVRILQHALRKAGYAVDCDGLFGPATESAVKVFQKEHNLSCDGIVGRNTWRALSPWLAIEHQRRTPDEIDVLAGFRGDLHWVHRWEGHAGHPYWPGGHSGVTLDPGFDLGHQSALLLRKLYFDLPFQALDLLETAIGLTGQDARAFIRDHDVSDIRITYEMAERVFPLIADKYWRALCLRFRTLADTSTPACVQTVMLSIGYNRGPNNTGLTTLEAFLDAHDWKGAGDCICEMQQDHQLAGIRRRRKEEGEYIKSHLLAQEDESPLSLDDLYNETT